MEAPNDDKMLGEERGDERSDVITEKPVAGRSLNLGRAESN